MVEAGRKSVAEHFRSVEGYEGRGVIWGEVGRGLVEDQASEEVDGFVANAK